MTTFPNDSANWRPSLNYGEFMQLTRYLGINSTCDTLDPNCDSFEARVTRSLESTSGIYQTVGKDC